MSTFNSTRFRQERLAAGISEERIALILHPDPHTVAAYESGRAQPSRSTLIRLAAAVGVEPVDLLVEVGSA
jgi:transcriptional regulator with XRE-family HTH domain